MAQTYQKILLSGSDGGRPVKVVATGTPGTTIHTALTGSDGYDEIWLWATNTDSTARALTLEFGGTTAPDDLFYDAVTLPADSAGILVVPGLVLNNAKLLKAFAAAANVVLLTGFVNRIK